MNQRVSISAVLLLAGLAGTARTQELVAPTPPVGWNSWDSFGTTITEAEVKANADYMAANLKSHGWQYIVVDIQWSEQNPMMHGYRPDADLGIHIMRGIPRKAVDANLPVAGSTLKAADIANKNSICRWNSDMYGVDVTKGGQAYYDSIVQLYTSWGLDFIKADDMFGGGEGGDHSSEIEALNKAIAKYKRPIALSLSPGTRDDSQAEFLETHAQMWRISGDFWDRWVDLKNQFARFNTWNKWVRPGHWPDGDMLPLGHIGIRAERGDPRMSLLTHDEQITLISLWSIARSPLMFGGHLSDNDEFTLSLMTNDEVLAVDQKATASKQLFAKGNQVAWTAELPGSSARYVAAFNTGDSGDEQVRVNWSDLGLPAKCEVRDLWAHKDTGVVQYGEAFAVKPHASGFYKVTPVGTR